MAAGINSDNFQSMEDQGAALNKCISIFKLSKNDNERFAALLLVTRLVQSDNIDSTQRRLLYDAIGFTFINRLLKTSSGPEDGLYQSLAIAILACFATDKELLLHPQMVSKIDVLNEMISNPGNDKSTINDAYQIISYFSSYAEGCQVLAQKNTISYLGDAILSDSDKAPQAWKILLNIASLTEAYIWDVHPKPLIQLVTYSAKQLRTLQDNDKFSYCSKLLSLLSYVNGEAFRNALDYLDDTKQLIADLASGLGDILQGKVTSCQRDPALLLVSVLVNLLPNHTKHVFLTNQSTDPNKADFFSLVTTTVCIEVRMLLDETTMEQLIEKANLLTCCYIILENIIEYLITVTDIDNNTQEAQTIVIKLYSQLTEVMMSVLAFLQQESIKYEEKMISCQQEFDVVLASSRVLLAWLAEESMALQKDVNKVLPFLIMIARDTLPRDAGEQETQQTFTNSSNIEVIRFMLPALCHLSSDENARQILIENSLQDVLLKCYQVLWKRCEEDSKTATESKSGFITLLGVLLNFAVTEATLVKNDASFKALLIHIIGNVSKINRSIENIEVLANLALLGLMLLRYQKDLIKIDQDKVGSFFKSVLLILKEADKLQESQDDKSKSLRVSVSQLCGLACHVIAQEFNDHNELVTRVIPEDVFQELMIVSSKANRT